MGGFDPSLRRLLDWDLILRYASAASPAAVPVPAAHYRTSARSRITNDEPVGPSWCRIRRKCLEAANPPRGLRVLYALDHYPQASETYIETEIRAMRRMGAHVEVWAPVPGATLCPPEAPVHRGPLAEAIRKVQPHVVHSHWLSVALEVEPVVAAERLPLTVRAHGFEVTPESLHALLARPAVRRVHVYENQARGLDLADPRIAVIRNAFDTTRFSPVFEKDRRLVLRTAAALASKQLASFLELAKRLPDHRFVLAIIACRLREEVVGELLALRREMESPAEIRVNVSHDEVGRLMGQAGIYLHTLAAPGEPDATPVGQPISIAEAMASGCHVLVRDLPPLRAYVGQAGATYRNLDEAASRIEETTRWTDATWRRAAYRAVDRAWMRHPDDLALRPVYDSWLEIAGASLPDAGAPRLSLVG